MTLLKKNALYRFFLVLFCFGFSFLSYRPAYAILQIDVSGAKSDPLPLAMPYFGGNSAAAKDTGREIVQVVENDLVSSGIFRIIDRRAYIQILDSINTRPNFEDWKAIKAQGLVYGQVEETQDGSLRVSYRLFDVYLSQQMEGTSLTTKPENWRRIAHMIADQIYQRITGEKGYFDTRIVYVAEEGDAKNRIKRLAIMDQDGENKHYLTNGNYMVLTPRFSPNMQQITYFSYSKGTPRIYLYDIETGKQSIVGDFPGMTFAPRFSPDGKKLIMSMAFHGNSEIYTFDLETGRQKRLTNHPAIDTSPSYSPDAKQIVFNSDRGGSQQLYTMNADGSKVRRITFGTGTYATPVWSPRGDYIAFTKIKSGKFYIGIIRPDGSGERLIAEGYLVESPSWSPNGRQVLFYRQTPPVNGKSSSKIYAIDITGHNERLIDTEGDASDPTWSPLLSR